MIIQLNDTWRVKTIPLNFCLEELVEVQPSKGKPPKEPFKWTVRGYYSGLRQCLHALPDYLAQTEGATSLASYFAKWDELSAAVSKGLSK